MNNINTKNKFLLYCGIAASLLYVAMNIVIPTRWPQYDWVSQTVSELSAIGAPTRTLWFPLGFIYAILMVLFGIGVVKTAGQSRRLKIAGCLLVLYGSFSLYWPPMHERAVLASGGGTLTDTLHLVWAAICYICITYVSGNGLRGSCFRHKI